MKTRGNAEVEKAYAYLLVYVGIVGTRKRGGIAEGGRHRKRNCSAPVFSLSPSIIRLPQRRRRRNTLTTLSFPLSPAACFLATSSFPPFFRWQCFPSSSLRLTLAFPFHRGGTAGLEKGKGKGAMGEGKRILNVFPKALKCTFPVCYFPSQNMREICSYPRLIHARALIGLLECFFFVAKEKELWPFRLIRVGRRIAARTALKGRGLAAAAPSPSSRICFQRRQQRRRQLPLPFPSSPESRGGFIDLALRRTERKGLRTGRENLLLYTPKVYVLL